MGCVHAKPKRVFEDPSILSSQTRFAVKEVKQLHELFTKLGSTITDDGFINREEFKLGLFGDRKKQSLFADRMFDLFDTERDGVLDFGELVRSLSVFHPETPQVEKIVCMDTNLPLSRYIYVHTQVFMLSYVCAHIYVSDHAVAFKLYDIYQTGFIEKEEVREMIAELLDESDLNFPDEIIKAIIDKTFEEADSRKDGKIDIEEWKEFAEKRPLVLRNMTIPQLMDMTSFPSFSIRSEKEELNP